MTDHHKTQTASQSVDSAASASPADTAASVLPGVPVFSGSTGGSETPAGTARRAIPSPSVDALYRAALTFCLDGTDVMMYATLKGAGSAESLWHALAQSHPSHPSEVSGPALARIDRMFVNGITRWGRSVTADMMKTFRASLSSWHNRMRDLPSQDILHLADWFTADGTMWLIGPNHPCWPHQLADLAIRSDWAPPLCLWIRGDPRALTSCAKPIGIVGSRDVNEYGRFVAHTVAEQAAAAGHLVVSGGAMGTDAAAHWGALNALHGRNPANVGKTVAVFAGGLNHIGPMRNRTLFERIEAQGGALISEHCPDTIPEARRFLLRNRIIAALSSTLVVAQARLRSGALNTAGWACELMREVYAVPGDINQPSNAGCNKMISDHRAILLCAATSTDDICHERHQPIMAACPGFAVKTEDAHDRQDDAATTTPAVASSSGDAVSSPASSAAKAGSRGEAGRSPLGRSGTGGQPTLAQAEASPARTRAKPGSSGVRRQVPDLREPADAEMQLPPIDVSTLPEPQRLMVGLIRECRRRHLIVTPDALLKVAHELADDEIPDIGTVLSLLGALELKGVVDRKADAAALSSRVR
nr:DNA-processing protein DprA [Bifidobacterium callitrichidarum]